MEKLFENQLKLVTPLTEDVLKELKEKRYFNCEEKKVGEKVLFAMLVGEVIEENNKIPELPMKLITLNERHFDLFEYNKRYNQNMTIPVLTLK